MLNRNLLIIGFIALVAVVVFNAAHFENHVRIGGKTIKVEIVSDERELARGLSGREGIAPDAGMLFVFPTPARHNFWMKDMNFSIDIIWLDEDGQVIYIKENASPESYPQSFGPGEDSKYVLEVYDGFSRDNNLKIGDKAKINSRIENPRFKAGDFRFVAGIDKPNSVLIFNLDSNLSRPKITLRLKRFSPTWVGARSCTEVRI